MKPAPRFEGDKKELIGQYWRLDGWVLEVKPTQYVTSAEYSGPSFSSSFSFGPILSYLHFAPHSLFRKL